MKFGKKSLLAALLVLVSACGGRNTGNGNEGGITGSGNAIVTAPENNDYSGTAGPGVIYTFVGWDASSTTGSYPSQMAIRCTSTSDPNLAATVSGNYTGHTNNSATGFGARGEGMGGISVLSTGTANMICSHDGSNPGYISAIDVGTFDTTGTTGLRVFFEAAQISDEAREFGLRLQYSTDGGSTFTDAPGPVEFASDSVGSSTAYRQFGPVAIPAIDNQASVVLRWRYYYISGSSGNRTRIALRNIRVSNDATMPSAPTSLTATALSHSSIKLDWTHGTDNVTTASYMRYDIYQATTSGGQNFSAPPNYTIRGTNTATISGLNASTTYYFVVRARDEQGNRESNTTEVSATTPADTTPPVVATFTPANGATYSTVGPVSVTFDKAMNPATVTTSSLKLVAGTDCSAAGLAASSITPSMGNTVFTINFTASKTDGQQYTTCVSTAVQSVAGVSMASAASATWNASDVIYSTGFETGFSKSGYAAGLTGPSGEQWNFDDALIGSAAGSDRFNGAQSARFNSSNANPNSSTCNAETGMCIEMNFDVYGAQQVRFLCARYGTDTDGTVKLQASTNGGTSWSDVGSSQSCAGTSLTMKAINVSYGSSNARFRIVKLTGGRLNVDDFEVRATPAPPSVISSNPANGATGVAFNPSASVTFSEAMNTTSVNSAYTVRETNCSGTVVSSGTPTASGGDTIFTYNLSGLTPSATYAICVTTAAQNTASVPIASAFSATFTTAALAEPTAVTFTPASTQVTVGWTNSSNANAGVKIVRATGSAPSDCNSGTTVCTGSGCNTNLTPGAAGRTYVDSGLTNGTTYHYRVCANHTGPAALSAGVTGSATPNDLFNVNSATSTSNTSVNVVFSHAPTPGGGATGSENAANYKIVLGAGVCTDSAAITVSAASLSGSTVTLTTASQSAISYRVCVSNVTRNSDSATLTTNNVTFTGTGAGNLPYNFSAWADTSTAGTYPADMQFFCVTSSDPSNTQTIGNLWSGPYNLTSNARIRGEGANGIGFINTTTGQTTNCSGAATGQFAGVVVLSLNTTGKSSIVVNWRGRSITAYTAGTNRQFKLTLEYSTDGGTSYTFATEEYLGNSTAGHNQLLTTNLPAAANNNANVRLRWRYVYVTGSGSRQHLALDDISIDGT